MSADLVCQLIWTAVANSSFDVLFTVAFALVLKVTKIWNLAQAAMMGVSFYTMFACTTLLGLPSVFAVAAGVLVGIVFAVGVERLGFGVFRARGVDSLTYFIYSLVLAEFTMFTLTLIFTTNPVFVQPNIVMPVWIISDVAVSLWDIRALAVTVVMVGCLALFLRYHHRGHYLIAVANNPELAEVYGISAKGVYALTMAIAAVFVTAGMYLFGSKLLVYPELTVSMLTPAVTASIIGGLGNVFAAAVAVVIINVIAQASVLFVDSRWQPIIVLGILFAGITCFPRGIYWQRRRRVIREPAAVLPAMQAERR